MSNWLKTSSHEFCADAGIGALAIDENTEPENIADAFQENIRMISGHLT